MAAELWVQTYNSSSSRPRVTWPAAGSGTVALPRRVSRGAPARAAANLDSGLLAPKPQLKARADGASAESKTRRPMTPHDRSIRMCRAVARLSRAGPRGRAPAAPGPHRVGVLPVPRRAAAARSARGGVWFAPLFGFAVRVLPGRGTVERYTPTLYSLACDGRYRISFTESKTSAVSLSAIGDRHARVYLRDGSASLCALVSFLDRLCSPLLPAARPGPAARSPAPCRRALYHLPQPMLMSISICASGVEASSPCRCCSSSPCRCRPPRT